MVHGAKCVYGSTRTTCHMKCYDKIIHMHMHMHETNAMWGRKQTIYSCIFSLVCDVTLISLRVASLCRANDVILS